MPSKHFFQLILFFLVLIALLITVIEIGAIQYAYEKIGINGSYVFALLLLSLLGSYVNIPIAELPAERVLSNRTVIAINLGGAVIPTLLSAYLLLKNGMVGRSALAVLIVSAIVYWMARPVVGVGIVVPTLVAPLMAAAAALLLAQSSAPTVAYIAGTLGTLIGADLLNLGEIPGLGAPIVSIGGAGTFDGIFLTGIIAVLLA